MFHVFSKRVPLVAEGGGSDEKKESSKKKEVCFFPVKNSIFLLIRLPPSIFFSFSGAYT
jgi:hypothetical protein